MNNKMNSKKLYDVFFIGSFFIALLCAAVVDLFLASMDPGPDDVVWIFFYTFFIVFIPSAITTFVFYITQEKQVATIRGICYWHF